MMLKPLAVRNAEIALWVWIVEYCAFGIGQTWFSLSRLEAEIAEAAQGMFFIPPRTILIGAIASYALIAVAFAWIVYAISKGKNWARSCLLWNMGAQALFALVSPHQEMLDLLSYIPDFGFQAYAAYLLYTRPGADWFTPPKPELSRR